MLSRRNERHRPRCLGRLFPSNGTFQLSDSICMPEGERRMLRKRNIAAVGGLVIALIASAGVARGVAEKSCSACGVRRPGDRGALPARACCSIPKPRSARHNRCAAAGVDGGCGCHMESHPTRDRQTPASHVQSNTSSMHLLRVEASERILTFCPAGGDPHAYDSARILPPPDEVCVLTTVLLI